VIFLGGIYDVMFQQLAYFAVPPINSWFGLIHLESLIYTIASAVFMIMMCKERLEIEYIKAAHLDPLTGAANRTAFFDVAERLLARCRATSTGAKKDRRTASDILIANLTNDAAALSLIRFADKP
jgi:hypothetical protein